MGWALQLWSGDVWKNAGDKVLRYQDGKGLVSWAEENRDGGSMAGSSNIPVVTHQIKTSAAARRHRLLFVRIGDVSFNTVDQNVVVRVRSGEDDYFLDHPHITALFPGVKVPEVRTSHGEMRFHLVRLLGEQGYRIVSPYIDEQLGVKK